MFIRIAEKYKCETAKLRPEKAEELTDLVDYFNTRCLEHEVQFEREHFAYVLSSALFPVLSLAM